MMNMAILGGKSVADVVCGMLKFLLAKSLIRRYNWFGLKGKLKFSSLKIASTLCSKYFIKKDIVKLSACSKQSTHIYLLS